MNISPLFSQRHHPIVIDAAGNANGIGLSDYLHQHAETVKDWQLQHGGVLFRGFPVTGAEDFDACAHALQAQPFDYVGGNSPRSRVSKNVYTSTEYPASEVISLHNEMSYLPAWPRRLLFHSVLPATSGGQTSLAHSADVLRAMPQDIVERFRQKKIRYLRNFPSGLKIGKSWQSTYQTEERTEAEDIVTQQGSTCTWLPDGSLQVQTCCAATATHPVTGQEVWFNQAEQWHPSALQPELRALFEGKSLLAHDCQYGDGDPLEEDVLATIRKVINANKLLFDWKKGDVLVVDNLLMMHGRESFKGARKTLAFLSAT